MHFDVAVFTNLTRDHLDYHGDMASYEAAKLKLFDWPGLKTAVVNLDDPAGLRLDRRAPARHFPARGRDRLHLRDEAEQPAHRGVAILRASQLRSRPAGTEFHLESPLGGALVKTQLVGHFNVSNALACWARCWPRACRCARRWTPSKR
jgi:UDP-N-acetylmuramoyl-L-alanyl-D-glutamate--2,6-diaminopimelate ligase